MVVFGSQRLTSKSTDTVAASNTKQLHGWQKTMAAILVTIFSIALRWLLYAVGVVLVVTIIGAVKNLMTTSKRSFDREAMGERFLSYLLFPSTASVSCPFCSFLLSSVLRLLN